ncbi:phage tail protein [Escherichia coli]|uniref:phage tail protein n=1 Tax=Escherichia coli TaxID=562 RepID=UPI001592B159|nr:phage tail protein [Escherichia coli]QKY39549.1 phage tail protein [Escherichia coli]
MATKYYAVLTNVGAAKLANATALGAQVEITQMAVGDGNGALPTPNPAQTALVHELRRAPLNTLSIDPNSANQIIAEQVIPEDEGGWWIREIGLFDKDGDMIAVANCAETYKPQLQEGSGRVQIVRMILIVSSTAAVTLKIDPSVVLATRAYVDSQIIIAKSYADDLMDTHLANANPHDQYPLIANALKEMADAGLVDEVLKNIGIKNASTTQVGLVRLTSSRVSGAEDIAATANAVAQNYTDIKSLQNKTQDSTTTQKGIVQLTSSRVSESETLAATAKAAAMNYADIQALQGKTNDATPTNKGIIRVSDSRTSTESGVAASSLAASQNYSDMKGLFGQCGMKSRNLGVVYTNSQSFAIFVSVNAVLSDGSSFLSADVNVDGNLANFRGSQTTNLAGQRATIAFMVPAGATYVVRQFSGTVSDVTWAEVDKK